MSIIDDALKGVERAQSGSSEVPVTSRSADSEPPSGTPKIVAAGVVGILAVAGVWWAADSWLSSGDPATSADPGLELAAQSASAESDVVAASEDNRSETLVRVATEEVAQLTAESNNLQNPPVPADESISIEVATLTQPTTSTGSLNSSPDGSVDVASLTKRAERAATEGKAHPDVAALTAVANPRDQASVNAEELTTTLDGLVELTASELSADSNNDIAGDSGASVAELTTETPAQTGHTETDTDQEVAALTKLTESAPAAVVQGVDSVAALTEGEDSQNSGGLAAGNVGDTDRVDSDLVSGLTALTAVDSADRAAASATEAGFSAVSASESVAGLTEHEVPGNGASPSTAQSNESGELMALTDSAETGPDRAASQPDLEDVEAPPTKTIPTAKTSTKTRTQSVSRDSAAVLRAALASESAGDYSAALKIIGNVEAAERELLLLKARLLARLGEYQQSSQLLVGAGPASLDSQSSFWLGYSRFNLQQWPLAVSALSRASQLDAGDALAALYLGMAQQQAGDFRGSIDAFHQARVLRPDMPEIAFNTGVSWWALGEKRRALGAFQHFMRITDGQRSNYAEQRRRVSQHYLARTVNN